MHRAPVRLLLALACLLAARAPAAPAAPEAVAAQLAPRRCAVLSAEIPARIDRMPLREGAAFRTGDTLVQFDDTLQRAQLSRAAAALEAARSTFAANEKLFALKSIGQVELEVSQAEVRKASAEVAYAEAMLAKCRVAAPYDGRVAELKARENEFAQPGQALLEIIDGETPEAECIAPSAWLSNLSPGRPVIVSIDETGRSYPAVIDRVSPRVEPVSRTVKIVARFAGRHPELAPGMSGTLALSATVSP